MDDALAEHIRYTAQKGLSRNEIKALLLKAGWPESQVTEYLQKAFKQLDKGVIIKSTAISKSFGQHQILENVDFEVNAGEIFGLIGMSGAGKTTLLNILVGFLKPEQGDIVLALPGGNTQSVIANPELIKQYVGFSTQTPSFYSQLTVRENLEHFGKLYQITEPDITRRVNALMELVGLAESKNVMAMHLSGGMQKRLDIACALLHDPSILILDEPTADLDPILRKQLWDLIKQINSKGTTIILASHFLAEIELLCTRIAILGNKKIIEIGTAEQLREIYSKNYEIFLTTTSKNYDKLVEQLRRQKRYFTKVTKEGTELVIQTPSPEHILPLLANTITHKGDLENLHVARPTLGRVFEAVMKR